MKTNIMEVLLPITAEMPIIHVLHQWLDLHPWSGQMFFVLVSLGLVVLLRRGFGHPAQPVRNSDETVVALDKDGRPHRYKSTGQTLYVEVPGDETEP